MADYKRNQVYTIPVHGTPTEVRIDEILPNGDLRVTTTNCRMVNGRWENEFKATPNGSMKLVTR